MIKMLNPPMRRDDLARAVVPPRASPAGRHPLRMACLAVVAVLGLLTAAAATPDLAAAAGKISKKDLKESCLKAPGSHWHESGDGSYGCWIGGFRTECTKDGVCKQYCYEEFGCVCKEWPGVTCVRKPQIGPPGSGDRGQVVDQGPVYADPEGSSPGPRAPGEVAWPDDQPAIEADGASSEPGGVSAGADPQHEPASSGPRIQPVAADEDEEERAA